MSKVLIRIAKKRSIRTLFSKVTPVHGAYLTLVLIGPDRREQKIARREARATISQLMTWLKRELWKRIVLGTELRFRLRAYKPGGKKLGDASSRASLVSEGADVAVAPRVQKGSHPGDVGALPAAELIMSANPSRGGELISAGTTPGDHALRSEFEITRPHTPAQQITGSSCSSCLVMARQVDVMHIHLIEAQAARRVAEDRCSSREREGDDLRRANRRLQIQLEQRERALVEAREAIGELEEQDANHERLLAQMVPLFKQIEDDSLSGRFKRFAGLWDLDE